MLHSSLMRPGFINNNSDAVSGKWLSESLGH